MKNKNIIEQLGRMVTGKFDTVPYRHDRTIEHWCFVEGGSIYYPPSDYLIPVIDLDEDWILHLCSKGWFDLNDFIPIYFEALKRAGHKTIQIKTQY